MRTWLGLVIVGMALIVGCTPAGPAGPTTYPVTGTVTMGGSPVEGATVTFIPTAAGSPATGATDAAGKFVLKTGEKDGAATGSYNISVVKYAFAAAAGGGAGPSADGAMPSGYGGAAADSNQGGKNELPAKFENAASSGLTATVTEDGAKNVFDLKLE